MKNKSVAVISLFDMFGSKGRFVQDIESGTAAALLRRQQAGAGQQEQDNRKTDPEYLVPYTKLSSKKGSQCGKCFAKFEYNNIIMYPCSHADCPMGKGPTVTL